MNGLRNHGLSLICLLFGVIAGVYLRTKPTVIPEVTGGNQATDENVSVSDADVSLAVRLEALTQARGNLTKSSFLQDLLSADAEMVAAFLQETDQVNALDGVSVSFLMRAFAFGRLAELDADAAWTLATRSGDREWATPVVFYAMLPDQTASVLAANVGEVGIDRLNEPLQEHPQKAVAILEHLPKVMDARAFVDTSFALWAARDSAEALNLLEYVPSRWRMYAVGPAIGVMVRSDPGKSLEFMSRLNPHELDRALRFASLADVVAQEPAAAEAFMETLPQGEARSAFLAAACAHKLGQDKTAALA